jgi:putative colanic acid biosynthesis glycosyltransferase
MTDFCPISLRGMSAAQLPRISVVTVNFNMADEIAGTLDSVLAQDYPHVEFVVIDGGSSDGSRAIIESYGPRLSYWASEPDRNLYDGMNKGVVAATGGWIIFMNSGDRFAAPDVLSRIFTRPHDDADALYGHHIRRYGELGIDRLIPAETTDVLPYRMHCSHQALLMRREWLLAHPFRLDILSADYESILAAHVAGRHFKPVDCVVAATIAGGRSDVQRLRSLMDRMRLVRAQGLLRPRVAVFYAAQLLRAAVVPPIKNLLPRRLLSRILRHRPIKGLG